MKRNAAKEFVSMRTVYIYISLSLSPYNIYISIYISVYKLSSCTCVCVCVFFTKIIQLYNATEWFCIYFLAQSLFSLRSLIVSWICLMWCSLLRKRKVTIKTPKSDDPQGRPPICTIAIASRIRGPQNLYFTAYKSLETRDHFVKILQSNY